MKQTFRWFLAAGGVAVVAACAPQTPAAEAPAPAPAAEAEAAPTGPVSVYTGVYSVAQAERGEDIQQRVCSACHSTGDWSQGRLLSGWDGASAYELITHIRNTMPLNAPGSLSFQEYTDIVAFMLQLNDIPAGDAELPTDEEALRAIELEYRR